MNKKVLYEFFYSGPLTTWSDLFDQARAFIETIGIEHVISISHSEEIVTVWYWLDAEQYAEQERLQREKVEQATQDALALGWVFP